MSATPARNPVRTAPAATDGEATRAHDLDHCLARFAAGEAEGFTELVAGTLAELRVMVAAHAASADMADEVVHATYVAAFEGVASYRGPGVVLPWLRGIARNMLRQRFRELARYQPLGAAEAIESELASVCAMTLDDDGQAERVVALNRCLDAVPAPGRRLLDHCYRDGWPLARIAQATGSSYEAVAQALSRLRARIRECMAKQGVRA